MLLYINIIIHNTWLGPTVAWTDDLYRDLNLDMLLLLELMFISFSAFFS